MRRICVEVIACIEDQDVIDRILAHLREKEQGISPPCPLPGTTIAGTAQDLDCFRWKGRAVAESRSTAFDQQGTH